MARTIKQIKKGMTDEFMASPVIRERYGLSESDTFDGSFSAVSLESILFGIVATAIYVLEGMFDIFTSEVDKKISTAILSTIPWYHKIALEYQHGDALVLNESTMQYEYPSLSPDKQLVKYAACRDERGYVYVLIAGAGADGRPEKLSENILTAFRQYMNERKPAGVPVEIFSYDPDAIKINLRIQYDSLVINQDGSLISNPSTYPVETAVTEYLYSIEYGGVFNKTRLIDSVQSVKGVLDVVLDNVQVKPANQEQYVFVSGNNYASVGGAFVPYRLKETISYVEEV